MTSLIKMIPSYSFVSKLLPYSQTFYYFGLKRNDSVGNQIERTDTYSFNNNHFNIKYNILKHKKFESYPYISNSFNVFSTYEFNGKKNLKVEEFINITQCTYTPTYNLINSHYLLKLKQNGETISDFSADVFSTNSEHQKNYKIYHQLDNNMKEVHDIFIKEIKIFEENMKSKDL